VWNHQTIAAAETGEDRGVLAEHCASILNDFKEVCCSLRGIELEGQNCYHDNMNVADRTMTTVKAREIGLAMRFYMKGPDECAVAARGASDHPTSAHFYSAR
jgi:hypothetical protein